MRSAPRRSRTSVSGSAMIRAPAHTTCTKSTARCHGQMLLRLSTKTWLPGTVPVSGRFTYVIGWCYKRFSTSLTFCYRSSRSLRLRRPMTSAAHTLSNSSPRTWNFLSLTALVGAPARRSSPHTGPQLSIEACFSLLAQWIVKDGLAYWGIFGIASRRMEVY